MPPASPEAAFEIAPAAGEASAGQVPAGARHSRFEARSMGSALRLQVVEPGPSVPSDSPPEALWRRVVSEFAAADRALSRFRPDSALTELNSAAGDGAWHPVEARLYRALAASATAWRSTGGRFDPRVLRDLERLGYRGAPLDHVSNEIRPDAPAVPWLERDPRRQAVRLWAPVDSGGIGKGLALRWAWDALAADLGPCGALIEAGGDLVGGAPGPDGGPWLIGIDDPNGRSDPLAVIALASGAVCTSSVAVTNWLTADGRAVHHLLDPRSGEPGGPGLLAVTVAGPDPAWSEVWSKALFLAGVAGIGEEARGRGLAAWWVTEDGTLAMTPAARLRTAWSRG